MTTPNMKTIEQMRLPELQATFRQLVGEETRSPNRTFLLRRIREALVARPAPKRSRRSTNERLAAVSDAFNANADRDVADTDEGSPGLSDGAADTGSGLGDVTSDASAPAALTGDVEGDADAEPAESARAAPVTATDRDVESALDAPSGAADDAAETIDTSTAAAPSIGEHAPVDTQGTVRAEAIVGATLPDAATHDPAPNSDGATADPQPTDSASSADVTAARSPRPTRTRRARSATSDEPRPPREPRGRFASMTVEELQVLYRSTVGRDTGSSDRLYLIWKVREAEKGRIPIGPRETRRPDQEGESDARILPLRLDSASVEALDGAWRARGMKSRMDFLRRALAHYLTHLGDRTAAAHFEAS